MVQKISVERLFSIVLIFSIVAVIAVEIIAIGVFKNNYELEIRNLQEQGRKLASSFDHELNVQEVTLEILCAEARSLLLGDKMPLRGTIVDLIPTSSPQGYTLGLIRTKTDDQIGNLTGLGHIPSPDSPLSKEIGMALSLSPLFEQVIKNNTSLPWVYYTSASRFVYMYPRISPNEFFYSDRLLTKEFFTIATPENNFLGEAVWSPVYLDEAGSGLMVTISKPIFDGKAFLGVMSIDMSLQHIKWLLEGPGMQNATAYLLGPDGKKMVGLGDKEMEIDIKALQPETLIQTNGQNIMIFPLREAEWYIVFDVDNKGVLINTWRASAYMGLLFIFVLFALILILVTTSYMRAARYMVIHDTLTGVLNRRAFDEISFSSLRKKSQEETLLGMAMIDIDYFKKYNDCYGHQIGDDALRRVANALKNSLRSPADKIYRVGGEEFAVMMKLEKAEDMPPILDRLVNGVKDLGIPHADSPFGMVTVSVGAMTAHPENFSDLDEIYRIADHTLFEAKNGGRNRWVINGATMSPGVG